MELSPFEDLLNDTVKIPPIFVLNPELFPAFAGQSVIARAPIIL